MMPEEFKGAVQGAIAEWQTTFESLAGGIPRGTLPVFYENGPEADESAVGSIWLDVEFRFYSGHLTEVGSATNRHTGVIAISVYTKRGEGTVASEAVLRSVTGLLKRRRWGGDAVTLGYERMTPPPNFFGWHRAGAMVSFYCTEKE